MQTSAENAVAVAAMRSSSVAIITLRAPLSVARRHTCSSIGLPHRSRSGLPGRRCDAKRAGMTTLNAGELAMAKLRDEVFDIADPLRRQFCDVHRDVPDIVRANLSVFYDILFGHEHRVPVSKRQPNGRCVIV